MGHKKGQRANKDVQKLVRLAREQGWAVTETANGRLMFKSPHGTDPVVVSPSPAYRAFKNTKAELHRAGLLDETPKRAYVPPPDPLAAIEQPDLKERPMTTVGEAARITVGKRPLDKTRKTYSDYSVPEQACLVWEYAIAQCHNFKVPTTNYDGVNYYLWTRTSMADLIGGIFPEITTYEGGTRPIYDFLRSTGNALNLTEKVGPDSRKWKWLIRCEWSEHKVEKKNLPTAVLLAEEKRRAAEQKVTPHEAGEDREPAPVEVRFTEPTAPKQPEPVPAPKPVPTPAQVVAAAKPAPQPQPIPAQRPKPEQKKVVLVDGRYKCSECDYTNEKVNSVTAHMQAHSGKKRAPKKGSNICPECRQAGVEYKAKNPQGLGAHRFWTHGIEGSSQNALSRNRAVERALREEAAKQTVVVNPPTSVEVTSNEEAAVAALDIDAAVAEFRERLVAEQGGVEALKERAEKAEATVEAIKEALATLPLPQAMAKIVEITAPAP